MPLVSVPSKAKEQYIRLCHAAWESGPGRAFEDACLKAHAYSDALRDVLSLEAWGLIVADADLSFPEGTPCCCGIPFEPKRQGVE
jgi:hypothetical protein